MIGLFIFTAGLSFYLAAKASSNNWDVLSLPDQWIPRLNLNISVWVVVWMAFQWFLYVIPYGGDIGEGPPGRNGHRFKFRHNGFYVMVVNVVCFIMAKVVGLNVSIIAEKSIELWVITFIVQVGISTVLLLTQKIENIPSYNVNPAANSGNMLQDWLMGKSISARIGFLDIKYVSFRSAMIGCVLYQLAVVVKHYETYHNRNFTLLLAVATCLIYLADGLWFEQIISGMKEVNSEGCGAMYLIYCITIPFQFSNAVNVIASTNYELPWYCLLAIAAIYLTGYWIYKGSNQEKGRFRQNPNAPEFKNYEVVTTSTGTNLLVSGWWGMCRHPNYLGDIILNFATCFFAGCSVLAYLNPVFVTMLLIDREAEDGRACKKKYGDDWDTYCHRVQYRIIPGVY